MSSVQEFKFINASTVTGTFPQIWTTTYWLKGKDGKIPIRHSYIIRQSLKMQASVSTAYQVNLVTDEKTAILDHGPCR